MARAHQVGQSVEWKFLTDRKLQEVDRSVWRGHIVVVNCMPMSCIRRGEWARFRRPGAVAISVPSRGGPCKAMERQLRPEAACLFPVPAPYESKLSTGPKPKTAGCFRNQLPFHCLAERARFELAIPFWGTHAFQACLFSHSSISPIRIRGLSVKTGLQR